MVMSVKSEFSAARMASVALIARAVEPKVVSTVFPNATSYVLPKMTILSMAVTLLPFWTNVVAMAGATVIPNVASMVAIVCFIVVSPK
jgi:MFS-type transporter involved in bile tolerance (Atg22 family)